jgi:hypothetical protein
LFLALPSPLHIPSSQSHSGNDVINHHPPQELHLLLCVLRDDPLGITRTRRSVAPAIVFAPLTRKIWSPVR